MIKKKDLLRDKKNIEDRNKELLNTSTVANKSKTKNESAKNAKNESDLNYDSDYAFYEFYRGF